MKKIACGVLVLVQQKRIWLVSMRTKVRSLAFLSGLRIWRCRELWCRSQKQSRSFIAAAVMQASSYRFDWIPSLGTSICHGCGPKNTRQNKTKQNKKEKEKDGFCFQGSEVMEIATHCQGENKLAHLFWKGGLIRCYTSRCDFIFQDPEFPHLNEDLGQQHVHSNIVHNRKE